MIRDAMRIRLVTTDGGSAWRLDQGPSDVFQKIAAKLRRFRRAPDGAVIVPPFG
jgi:hypothetical protein